MKKLITITISLLISCVTYAQDWVNSTAITSNGSVVSKEILIENGNIYACGSFTGAIGDTLASYGSTDWFLAKYDSDYSLSWIKKIGGIGQERDVSMAFDSNNDISIGGSYRNTCYFSDGDSLESAGLYDLMLAKYNHLDGSILWKKTIAWGTTGQLIASIDIDDNDDIIIAGFYKDSLITNVDTLLGTGFQNFILKLDANGDFLWSKNILSSNTLTRISAVSAFSDAYYFSGTYRDSIFFDNDSLFADIENTAKAFVYKIDLDGKSLWARGSYGDNEEATGAIAQDNSGNIYFSGYYRSTNFKMDADSLTVSAPLTNNGSTDLFIAKYNTGGDLLWLKGYGKAGSDFGSDIKEKEGILYFTGYYSDTLIINLDTLVNSNAANKDIFLATADSDGNLLKGEALNGVGVFDDFGVGIEITDDTHAILFGDFYSTSLTVGSNILTNSVSPSSLSFIAEYNPPFSAQYTSIKEVTCNGGSDGELIVTPYFGVSPYTYTWSNSAPNDSVATNLSAGITYTVTVTDALASEAIAQYKLVEPDFFTFNPIITHVTSCSDSLEGVIDLNVTGGNGGNTYYWIGSGTELTTEDQDSLAIGAYSVTVTDSESCTGDTTINITGPEEIHFGNSDTTSYYGAGSEGAIDLEITGGTGTPSLYAASWTGPDSYTNTVQDINTLQPGTYNVTVTDANSCIEDTSFVIVNKFEFSSYIESKKDACNGVSDGRAVVNYYSPIGHTAITYLWDANAGNQVTAEATGLTGSLAGIKYYVTVTDTEEEPDVSIVDSVIIYELAYTFSGTLDGTNVKCKGDTNGIIDLTPMDGIEPYVFSWSNGKDTEDIDSLIAGLYSVTVVDKNECAFSIIDYEITEPELLVATAGIVNEPLCNGHYNGSVGVNVGGGNGGYGYTWDDSGNQSTSTAINLGAGLYNVTVNDSKGCTDTSAIYLTEPEALSVSGSITDLTCFENSSGAIDVTVGGGILPYVYQWNTTDDTEDLVDIAAGTYDITVTDDNLCLILDSYTVNEPPALEILDTVNVDITTCNGDKTGVIVITATGGTGVLNYTLNPGASQINNTGIFESLSAGYYTVEVNDENGCEPITSDTIKISEPTAINIEETSVINVDCNGDTSGSIDVTITGGTVATDYTYLWSNGETTQDLNGLGAGDYSLTVTDDNSCTAITSITLTEPVVINIDNSNNSNPTCNGLNDGNIDVTVTGGTVATDYTYLWSNGETTQDLNGLGAGDYSLTVTDDNSCTAITSITLTEPLAINIDNSTNINPTCNGLNDGSIDVTITGGTVATDYTYLWSNVETTQDLIGLGAGDYSLTVTDDNSCTDTISISLSEPDAINIDNSNNSNPTCNGLSDGSIDVTITGGTVATDYTYLWSTDETTQDLIGLGAGDYSLTVTDDNSCTDTISISLSEPDAINIDNTNSSNPTCNGLNDGNIDVTITGGTVATDYAYLWSTDETIQDLIGLGAGDYSLTVTDDNSCTDTILITLSEPDAINLDNSNNSNPTCNGSNDGSIDITISGGTITTEYTYNWSTTDGSGLDTNAEDQTGLTAGTYDVTVNDDNSCASVFEILLDDPDEIAIDTENSTDASSQTATDGSVTITASGGTGTLDYELNPGSVINQTGIFSGLASGDYTVNITDDNNCGPVTSANVTVGFIDAIDDVIANNNIKIYPNPTADKVFIEIDFEFDNLQIEILSISGQVLLIKEIESHGITKEEIDLSAFPKGVYLIRIYNNIFNFKRQIFLQ